ncbi:MAG: flagellar hook capping protein [Myxococcaceae bacterium]|nr:flagellar hook capping protein [Myxococcaceae bacterium]
MAVGSVDNTGISAPTVNTSAATSAKSGNALGPDDFMKLLVAQLKNQDPNNPLDTKELVTQLSQLTSVQELTSIGKKMGALTTATNGMAANQSAGLIGKTVSGLANTAQLGPTGGATSAVTLAQSADSATVSISDVAGRVVKTFTLPSLNAGPQALSWDGTDTVGQRAPAGTYTFSVDAKNSSGQPVATDMTVSGIVTGVDYDSGTPELAIGKARIPLTNITTISQ